MNVHPTEYRYQKEIIKYLSSHEFNGLKYTYLKDGKYDYDRFKCIIPSETLKFIEKTQPDTFNDILKYKSDSERFITKLVNDSVLKIGLMGFYPGKNNRKRVDVLINVLKRLIEKKVDVELIVQGTGWDKYYDLFEKIGVNYKHYKFSEIKNMYNFFEKLICRLCCCSATPYQEDKSKILPSALSATVLSSSARSHSSSDVELSPSLGEEGSSLKQSLLQHSEDGSLKNYP